MKVRSDLGNKLIGTFMLGVLFVSVSVVVGFSGLFILTMGFQALH